MLFIILFVLNLLKWKNENVIIIILFLFTKYIMYVNFIINEVFKPTVKYSINKIIFSNNIGDNKRNSFWNGKRHILCIRIV